MNTKRQTKGRKITSIVFCTEDGGYVHSVRFPNPVTAGQLKHHELCTESFNYAIGVMEGGGTKVYVSNV